MENSDLFFSRAWETAKAYQNSDMVRRYNGILDSKRAESLHNFLIKPEHQIETLGVDIDDRASEYLNKYTVIPMTPTRHLDELDGNIEAYLIVDSQGHDIGIQYITENGPEFILSEKIKNSNNEILKKFQGKVSNESLEAYKMDTLDKVAERIARGKHVGLANEKEVVQELNEKGVDVKSQEEEKTPSEQEENIPEEMRGDIAKYAAEAGVQDFDNVKQVLTIKNPNTLVDGIDNSRTNIERDGGEVIAIRIKNTEANVGPDKTIFIQNGRILPQDEKNNEYMENIMNQKTGTATIDNLKDNREEEFKIRLETIKDKMKANIEMLQSGGAEPEEIENARKAGEDAIMELVSEMKPASIQMQEQAAESIQEMNSENNYPAPPEEHSFPETPGPKYNH